MCVHRQSFDINNKKWKDHVHKLELALNQLKKIGLQCNIEESFF